MKVKVVFQNKTLEFANPLAAFMHRDASQDRQEVAAIDRALVRSMRQHVKDFASNNLQLDKKKS